MRNGFRSRTLQTAEGELSVEIPQVREAAAPFVSRLFPRGAKLLRTEPLKALVIGAFVRGLSMRDVESLCEEAGLGSVSKASAARICTELRDRFQSFQRRDLYEILEERYGRRSTILTSQIPVDKWHEVIGDPTYADAILDRLVHNAHRIDLAGHSLRRTRPRSAIKD